MLTEDRRKQLDDIVNQMAGHKETDETIQFVVNDFKAKYENEAPPISGNQFEQEKPEGFLAKARDFTTGLIGGGKLAEGLGQAIAAPSVQKDLTKEQNETFELQKKLLQAIRNRKEQGGDTSRLENALKQSQQMVTVLDDAQQDFSESLATNKEVVGSATRLAGTLAGGSLAKVGAKATSLGKATTVTGGALRGAGAGAISGAGMGAVQGAGLGLEANKSAKGVALSSGLGTLTGGVVGGALGALTGGVMGGLKGKALRKQQILEDLTNNPDTIARYKLNDTGNVVKDSRAKEILKQGLPEKQVAVVKNASEVDNAKFKKMFGLAQKASKDARAIERPSDVVGESIVTRTKHLLSRLRISGNKVDKAAQSLKGQTVNPEKPIQEFLNDLTDMGVRFEKGKAVFAGSDIEGIKPAENLITKVLNRMQNVSDDANELHKLKKFIDEQVTYGKAGEGLTGQTERVMKSLRKGVDNLLDTNFADYNNANTAYSKAITLLDDTKSVLGRNFNPSAGTVRAGAVARRILGNSANRGDIVEYLKSIDEFYKATGGKNTDDIITQTIFADMLEEVFGTQATTGLQGQVERAVVQAGGVAQDVAQGQPLAALARGAVRIYQATRGITSEARVAALGKLIGL